MATPFDGTAAQVAAAAITTRDDGRVLREQSFLRALLRSAGIAV
jgi:hypothetical protein